MRLAFNIRRGAGVFLNFSCVILDVVAVSIGAGTQIGPGCKSSRSDYLGFETSPKAIVAAAKKAEEVISLYDKSPIATTGLALRRRAVRDGLY